MSENDQKLYYQLGKRDCALEILMQIRLYGIDKTIENIIEAFGKSEIDNPHIEYFKKEKLSKIL